MEKALNNTQTLTIDPNDKTICVIQLTRIGDILQTIQSVENLKTSYPKMKLKLVARKRFAKPLNVLLRKHFDEVHYLDLPTLIDPISLANTQSNIHALVSEINKTPNDLVVNLSFSKPSSYLAGLIEAEHRLGVYHDANANQQIPDKWSQYIYSTVMAGDNNPFALIDIFNHIFGVEQKTNRIATINRKSRTITVHPFSSSIKKNWNINKWAEVIYKLLKSDDTIEVNIIGSGSERPLAEDLIHNPILQSFESRIHNQTGQTSIIESMEIIRNSRFFIGHDSMASHLASLVKRTSIIISLGTVRPHETAPYSENNYILVPKSNCFPCNVDTKCDFMQCHADIPYQLVYTMASHLLNSDQVLTSKELETDNTIFHLNSVSIYRTTFNENKMLRLENLLSHRPTTKEIMKTLYRITWLFYLAGKEEHNDFADLTEETYQDLSKLLSSFQQLFELSEFGKTYSHYILSEISSETPKIQKIKEYSEKIDEIERLSNLLLKTAPLLAPLVQYFATMRANLNGANIVELTEQTYLAFHDTTIVISVIYELLEKTLAEYQVKVKKKSISSVSQR